MKKNLLFLSISFLLISFITAHAQVDTVIARYKHFLITTTHIHSDNIRQWISAIHKNGEWPDINYKDESRANWQLWDHLKRLDQLSVAWSDPESPFYHHSEIWKTINLALNDWLNHPYQNPNWWHNQIGVPQCMRDIIVLLRDTLTEWQLQQALKVMAQLHVQKNGAGANLTWSADLGFHYGALINNRDLMDSCRQLILHEIHISNGEGIQPDYSFHQHGSRLQMYQYGKAFLFTNIRLAWEMRNTQWAFPEDKINILTDLLLKGWQWMARGINTVPGTMDRSASRVGELRSPDIRYLIPFLRELDPAKTSAFETLAAHQNGTGSLSGFRYYPYSDFAAYQNKDFSFFLKTISTRTLSTEVGLNSENLKGQLLNSGDAYLINDGNEYYDLMPVWDWQKLPGITAFKEACKMERKPFVGSVSDGQSGLTAMDYDMENKTGEQQLTAHKIWACHKNTIVRLIANVQTKNIKDDYTVLDQCRLQGRVAVNKPDRVINDGVFNLKKVKWIYHHHFAYIPINAATIELKTGKVTGRWSSINASETDSVITDSVFMSVMRYNAHANHYATGYVLAYCETPEDAMNIYQDPDWKILQNDKNCQAVKFGDGTIMVAFFNAGSLKTKNILMQVDTPCLVLMVDDAIYVSDPAHQGGIVHISLDHKMMEINMAADGTTTEIKITKLN